LQYTCAVKTTPSVDIEFGQSNMPPPKLPVVEITPSVDIEFGPFII
jgi:hypothetical protein